MGMQNKMITLSFGIGALLLATHHAFGQDAANCAPRETILQKLRHTYNERRVAIGLSADNSAIEMFASSTGSWTLIASRPDGITCILSFGQAFELDQPRPAGNAI